MIARAGILLFCLLLVGCASGPKLEAVAGGIPKVADGQGRVYFYRTGMMGTAIQPGIYVNGEKVGVCKPGGVFYKDLAPGNYSANVTTEVERALTFSLAAGEEKFVRCSVSMGIMVGRGHLELIDPVEGRADLSGLAYTGQ